MTARTSQLAALAAKMGLSPTSAVALPEVVTRAASHAGLSEDALILELDRNKALRDYLAGVCVTVTR